MIYQYLKKPLRIPTQPKIIYKGDTTVMIITYEMAVKKGYALSIADTEKILKELNCKNMKCYCNSIMFDVTVVTHRKGNDKMDNNIAEKVLLAKGNKIAYRAVAMTAHKQRIYFQDQMIRATKMMEDFIHLTAREIEYLQTEKYLKGKHKINLEK